MIAYTQIPPLASASDSPYPLLMNGKAVAPTRAPAGAAGAGTLKISASAKTATSSGASISNNISQKLRSMPGINKPASSSAIVGLAKELSSLSAVQSQDVAKVESGVPPDMQTEMVVYEPPSNKKNMSRTKKEIISAVINGQQLVQIEKLNGTYQSHGTSDQYL
jgi:hypothetical protein